MLEEKDIERIRAIIRDEVHEILDVEILGPLADAFTGFEAVSVQFKHSIGSAKGVVAVKEETLNILKFEDQQVAKIGPYQVAYEKNNIPEKFTEAFDILQKNNATINSRYHSDGYLFAYWLYGEGKIYRQKLKGKGN